MHKVYKVVRIENDSLVSLTVPDAHKKQYMKKWKAT